MNNERKCNERKTVMKEKQRRFKDDLVNRLSNLAKEDPNAFWTMLKTMQSEESCEDKDISRNISNSKWQEHFSQLGSVKSWNMKESPELTHELNLLESQNDNDSQAILDQSITIREIKDVIKGLKNNKAHGDDLIANEILKCGAPVMLPAMAKLFNLILESGVFPTSWNRAYQVPLYKKGDPLDCNNYRGISITSCLGKTFNSVLCQRLNHYIESEGRISDTQAAFRKKHSTCDHIYVLKSLVNKYVARHKSKLYCCFVDFRKAYDRQCLEGRINAETKETKSWREIL